MATSTPAKKRSAKSKAAPKWEVEQIRQDYYLAWLSRHASLIGRREVLSGQAKFGIFGDGKELAQIGLAKSYQPGDIRSGYYRDQTLMFATGMSNVLAFFAQLYAHPSTDHDPASGGRMMNAHFGTRMLDEQGNWLPLTDKPQSSIDISPTAGQMPRMVGLAQASKVYRNVPELHDRTHFSKQGDEVCWGSIGDASTSEGLFWETVNAVGVLQVPLILSVWDDNYGISVPIDYQTTKGSISEVLEGFHPGQDGKPGVTILTVKAWDYPSLIATYQQASELARTQHQPVLVHVQEVTQPQGHSTSGSHERYKSKERLAWEQEYDCLNQFRQWILEQKLLEAEELDQLESQAKKDASQAKNDAKKAFQTEVKADRDTAIGLINALAAQSTQQAALQQVVKDLQAELEIIRRHTLQAVAQALLLTAGETSPAREELLAWNRRQQHINRRRYSSHLHSESPQRALNITPIQPAYSADSPQVDGREVLQACFRANFARDPRVLAFGEDLGHIGDVNQAFAGLQAEFGETRIFDTGIREATIMGQGIGLAQRGLRPIAEIQYLDYLLYGLQILSDDLATLQYRSVGGQKAPLIVRTRGHRLEGIWHSGSPMGMILHALRGLHVCVPRDMTRAAGLYNTLLRSDEPALVIEVLNGYRLKERLPDNVGEFTLPLGQPEILREGADLTVVTYGPNCRLALQAAELLQQTLGVSLEVIDVQTLLPFDQEHRIVESLKKTNRLLVLDEDVPGGASAYILQHVLETQNGYRWLDSQPRTLTAQAHRPAYASDGDYFSKPNQEDILRVVSELMHEFDPARYPLVFG